MVDKAQKALSSIDCKKLNKARQEQCNNARLMLQKAEDQLKASNFDLARENADKAYRIANELQGR